MAADVWVEIRACPYCLSNDFGLYKIANSPPSVSIDFCNGKLPMLATMRFDRCNQCGLIVQNPRMSDDRIAFYYASGTYRATLGQMVADMDRGEMLRARTVADWLKTILPKSLNSHLDIGCSRGYFLKQVNASRKYGWDFNHEYAQEQIEIIHDKAEMPKCELVSALHVLEHTTDPLKELKWYKSLSSHWVLIEVPRVDSGLRFPHLFYFPVDVLAGMFKKAGMRIHTVIDYPNTRILAEVPV